MTSNEIALLKYAASTEYISVEYYDGGKIYSFPVASLLLDEKPHTLAELDDTTIVFVDCSYKMQLGTPLIQCDIVYGESGVTKEQTLIPLDAKRRTQHQRDLMSLINFCSKRVIAQEMSRSKYALSTAVSSMTRDKQYN